MFILRVSMSSSIDSGLTFVGSENRQASIHHRPTTTEISGEEGRGAALRLTCFSALQGKNKIKLKTKKTPQASKLSPPPPPPARDAAVAKVQTPFSSCRWRKGANLLRLHPGMGMRKVQFPFAACCCWCCGFRRCCCSCCTSSKFPPPKAAAAAQDPMPREAAAIPNSKAKCRNWATSRSRRPTGSPCGWRALLRMQQFPGMPKSPTPPVTKWCPWTAKISARAPILLLARAFFFLSPLA